NQIQAASIAARSDNRRIGAMPSVPGAKSACPAPCPTRLHKETLRQLAAGAGAHYNRDMANPRYDGIPGFNVENNDAPAPPMPSPSRYAGIPGFNVDTDDGTTPSSPPPERSLVDNHELITDLARFSEALCTESAIRKKWRLSEETWELLGSSDE